MPTIVHTPGAPNANSFESLAEANTYFDERLPLPTPWVASGDENSERALIMATRVLSAMNRPHKTIRHGRGTQGESTKFYYTNRQWTGTPASTTQKLAWPRMGMFDGNGNPLDIQIESIAVGDPTVITTRTAHRRATGDVVFIVNTDSTPRANGAYAVTVVDETSFTIDLAVTVAGTLGNVTWMPQELKDAQSELAGQLRMKDTTLDNASRVGGVKSVKAGSVQVTFNDIIDSHVLPDAVLNLMPPSWLTDELVENVYRAGFDII